LSSQPVKIIIPEPNLDHIKNVQGDNKANEELRRYKNDRRELKLKDFEQLINQKRTFSVYIFILVSVWLTMVLGIVIFNGFGFFNFGLSEKIIITLIGSTTVNILGLLVIVLKYIFNSSIVP
jgi:hypothetical protein